MEKSELEAMPLDLLWSLHEELTLVLSRRIMAEKRQLENRLVQLHRVKMAHASAGVEMKSGKLDRKSARRHYPAVFPKYRNPAVPTETWSGRGKQPRWLVTALEAGARIEDFMIPAAQQGKVRALR